ncbi:MAG: ABC transporter substrate-binding protein [bacterium]
MARQIRSKLSKNILKKFSIGRYFSKPLIFLKAIWNVLYRIQPLFSIIIALIISLPIAYSIVQGIDNVEFKNAEKIYKEGVIGNLTGIDPLPQLPLEKPFSQLNRDVTHLLFDPLFSTDTSGNPVGILAESYEAQSGGSKFNIKLKDRKWSDGTKITSADVVETFSSIQNSGVSGLYYSSTEGVKIEAVDDLNFSFTLDVPNSAFLETLYWPVLPAKNLVVRYDVLMKTDFAKNPISSTDWEIFSITDKDITLKNHSNRKLKFVFFDTQGELEKALNSGVIDGYSTLEKIAEKNYTTVSKFVLPRQLYAIYFNLTDTGSPIIKDPIIRKAISYSIDRNGISQDVGVPRQSIIIQSSWAFNPNANTYPIDIQKANDILDQAGYAKDGDYRKANGVEIAFTISIPDVSIRKKQAEYIQEYLKKVGIRMNIKAISDTQIIDNERKFNLFYNSVVLTKNYEAMIYSVDSGLDPDKFSQWHSTKIPDYNKGTYGLNFSGYSSVRVDNYLTQGRKQTDQNARKTPYNQFQKVFYEDAPVIALYNPYLFYVTSKKISNVNFTSAFRIENRFVNFNEWKF